MYLSFNSFWWTACSANEFNDKMMIFLHYYRDMPFLCPLFNLFDESQPSLTDVLFLNAWTAVNIDESSTNLIHLFFYKWPSTSSQIQEFIKYVL